MSKRLTPIEKLMNQNINRGEAIKEFCKRQCNRNEPCEDPILNCGVDILLDIPKVKKVKR